MRILGHFRGFSLPEQSCEQPQWCGSSVWCHGASTGVTVLRARGEGHTSVLSLLPHTPGVGWALKPLQAHGNESLPQQHNL